MHSGYKERCRRDEAGMTLVEMAVSISLLALVVAMFLTVLVGIQRSVAQETAKSISTDEVRLAAQQLDRHIRSGNVLYDPQTTVDPGCAAGLCLRIYTQANATQKCVQWRVVPASQELQWRSWTPDWEADPAARVSGWRLVASGVANTTADPAFSLDNGALYGRRIMKIALRTRAEGDSGADARITLSVTGRNTQYGYPDSICNVIPPV